MSQILLGFLLNHNRGIEKLPKYSIFNFNFLFLKKSRENYKISSYGLPNLQIDLSGIKMNSYIALKKRKRKKNSKVR
jgi:hypothetical protein